MVIKIGRNDLLYPESLKNLIKPPPFLNILMRDGDRLAFTWPKKSVAIVGSRNVSDYGRRVIWDLVPKLVGAEIAIISGLVEGVDEEAQRAVLKAGGATIGVLGFGIMRLGDFSNKQLAKAIVDSEKGFLVSSFDTYVSASKYTFLERNRIIAGLANGLLVIEAMQKSGCAHTVEAALELGKEVYAVPGSVFSYTSTGTNELIKQGAHPVTCAEDICGILEQ